MTNQNALHFLSAPDFSGKSGQKIAYIKQNGQGPGIIWCGGLKSDMYGTKAVYLDAWAQKETRTFIRFDYFGHGASSGRFRDGTISRWVADTVQVIDELTEGSQILIGSSMGGWTSLLAALARPERIKAMLLIAPAPDFTEKLMWAQFDEKIRRTIMEEGIYFEPSGYDEPYEISRDLIMDGRKNLLLDQPIKFDGSVRILQGIQDTSVPPAHARKVMDALTSEDVELTLVKKGDHSLSTPSDLGRLIRVLKELIRSVV